jgi:hypothetical protein
MQIIVLVATVFNGINRECIDELRDPNEALKTRVRNCLGKHACKKVEVAKYDVYNNTYPLYVCTITLAYNLQ